MFLCGSIQKATTLTCHRGGILTIILKIIVGDAIPEHRDVTEENSALPGLAEGGPAGSLPAPHSEEAVATRRQIREVTISADALIDLGRLHRSPPFTIQPDLR